MDVAHTCPGGQCQGEHDTQHALLVPWGRVGNNAEIVAWSGIQLQHCPYPLDIALERFYTGQTQKHSALAHFSETPVTTELLAWFGQYNACQTIEADIKEAKQVFNLHRLKVRSEPTIYLQEP